MHQNGQISFPFFNPGKEAIACTLLPCQGLIRGPQLP